MDRAKAEGPTLVVDSGNAVFKGFLEDDEASRKKARWIAKTMGELGTQAMAVGMRDLAAGPEFLQAAFAKTGVSLLSANLERAGKPVFAPSRIVRVGRTRVGLVGLSPPNPFGRFPGLVGTPLLPALEREVRRLSGKVDLIVVLAAVPHLQLVDLGERLGAGVDVILQSHDARVSPAPMPLGRALLINGGDRGRAAGRLDLDLAGRGPLQDGSRVERERQRLTMLESQIAEVRRRIAASSDPGVQAGYRKTLADFERRRGELARELSVSGPRGRTLTLQYVHLGREVPGDPGLEAAARPFDHDHAH